MDYFDQQNQKFFDFLNDMFNIKKAKNWSDISKNITEFKMKRTYRVFADLFPRKIDYLSELEKNKETFKSIHYAKLSGQSILNEIVRFSLYSDQIIVFHPLQNPAVTNERMNPGRNPLYWYPDFMGSLYFYIVIQKWVKAGIVKLIINPYEYDIDLRDKIDAQVQTRIKNVDMESFYKISGDSTLDNLAEQFAIFYKNKDSGYIKQALLDIISPKFNEKEATEFTQRIVDYKNRINPLYNKALNINTKGGMVAPTKGGGPVESILLISNATNGNIYTPDEMAWYQMQQMGLNDFWLKASRLFSKVELNFLNNVDTTFALKIREDERLVGVRSEMKKLFNELNSISISDMSETKMKYLFEGFTEEIKKSEAEWLSIKNEEERARKYWVGANAILPIITTNETHIIPMALASGLAILNSLRTERQKIALNRIKNPISVFVDLKNQKPSFFSELKNCLV